MQRLVCTFIVNELFHCSLLWLWKTTERSEKKTETHLFNSQANLGELAPETCNSYQAHSTAITVVVASIHSLSSPQHCYHRCGRSNSLSSPQHRYHHCGHSNSLWSFLSIYSLSFTCKSFPSLTTTKRNWKLAKMNRYWMKNWKIKKFTQFYKPLISIRSNLIANYSGYILVIAQSLNRQQLWLLNGHVSGQPGARRDSAVA